MTETVPIPTDALTLIDASVLPHSGGEMAAGNIRVTYTVADSDIEVTYEIEFDTRVGPDGLHTGVTTTPGDSVTMWTNGEHGKAEAPERVIEQAKRLFARYRREAVTSMPPQSGVCFADIIPVDSEDITEIAG